MSVEENIQLATTPLSTGPRLHYAERGDPKGEAIVFLHGYSDSWFSFSRVLPLLAPSYHAFALTQRGHGDSDKPECCYTPEDFAADIDAFMDTVGIEEATLVGASTGPFLHSEWRCATRAVLAVWYPVPAEFVRGFQESTIYQPVPQEFLEIRWSQRASSSRPGYGAIIWSGQCFLLTTIMCSRCVRSMCRR
jgi:non-heme chloroperoxidase